MNTRWLTVALIDIFTWASTICIDELERPEETFHLGGVADRAA